MEHYYRKTCNLSISCATELFAHMNVSPLRGASDSTPRVVNDRYSKFLVNAIIIPKEPDKYMYPEGWYYDNGYFTNVKTTTTQNYGRAPMLKPNGESWAENAPYCTLDFDQVEV